MTNSHRPPDTTRRSSLCRVRRCELSLETVWQSQNSQPIDHPRRVAFSEEVRFSHMQQSTACLHFAWRTTSLRVGGRAGDCVAACLACVAAAAVDRRARQSCRVWCGGVN